MRRDGTASTYHYYSIIAGDHKQTSRADRQHVAKYCVCHAARTRPTPRFTSTWWLGVVWDTAVLGPGRFGSANLLRVRSAELVTSGAVASDSESGPCKPWLCVCEICVRFGSPSPRTLRGACREYHAHHASEMGLWRLCVCSLSIRHLTRRQEVRS